MISVTTTTIASSKNDTLVVFVWEGVSPEKSLPKALQGKATELCSNELFTGKRGEKRLMCVADSSLAKKVLFVGLGNKREFSLSLFRSLVGDVYKYILGLKLSTVSFFVGESLGTHVSIHDCASIIATKARLASYLFDKYKTKKKNDTVRIKKVVIVSPRAQSIKIIQLAINRATIIADAVNNARDLINEPPNKMTPQDFARRVLRDARRVRVPCKQLDLPAIIKEKMGGLLAVAQGSNNKPVFLILHYKPTQKKKKTICLVGKGICFDSGGISLKSGSDLMCMKYDMAGGAVCAYTVLAAAQLKIPHEVIGLIPLCENVPDGTAYRPGDIITMASGSTVEVLNTDAEGRIILADALNFSARYKPDVVVDMATLTGAVKVCFGDKAAALLGNNERLMMSLQQIGEEVGERLWPLPLWEEYQDDLKSDAADMKNVGFKGAGTICGAKFLSNFIPKTAWAHIDIASVSWEEEGKPFIPKGASGFGVRLLVHYLLALK
ncbi:MAG: leucyl aminopeptidase [Candidatus Omnitrophica bacterium]|nr:leucyl aminopeptidase [Candidatus Omnitrophota bacterium]